MAVRLSEALRTARAQAIVDTLDGGTGAGELIIYSGGRADPDGNITSIPNWAASTVYQKGDYVKDGFNYYRANNVGLSDSTKPTFPTNGSTVLDNNIVWQDMGEIPKKLGVMALSSPSGVAEYGKLTFNEIFEESAAITSGTATWARFVDGDGVSVFDVSVGLLGSGAELILNTTTIIEGGGIRIKDGTTPELTELGD